MIKKLISTLLIVTTVIVVNPIGAKAAWKNDNTGWWYTQGDSYSSGWKQVDGSWYYFGNDGYMKTGWLKDGSQWYYFKDNGTMATGRVSIKDQVYEFDNNGKWINNSDSNASASNQIMEQNSIKNTLNSSAASGDSNISQNLIYETSSGSVKYRVYTSKSVDTLLIAAALYNNFQGDYLMPNSDKVELFKAAKEYFSPYANHEFIKNFGKYMDSNKAGDINSALLQLLLCCTDLPDLSPKFDVNQKLPDNLKSNEVQEEFLAQLKSFYNDTHAEDFFSKNSSHYDALTSYIKNNEDASGTIKLINAAVDYTGNKEKYYGNKEIIYCTLLSFYRFVGSFYTVPSDTSVNFVSIQNAYRYNNQSQDNFDINHIAQTSVHEYLHNFVNTPVYENVGLINSLTKDKNKTNYCSKIYYGFPWNRITDESFVRAIEARLYKNVLNENLAFSEIINPEIKAGFSHTQALYNKLDYYEKDRQNYPSINDFIPTLINDLYS